ncbi:MAG: Ribonuclease R [Xylophilus sp.]|nr:MAG: Ribonuclease R [Xylophilus sp.]
MHRVIKAILGGTRYQLPSLPTPGEAHAKLAKRLASRVAPPKAEPGRKPSPAAQKETAAWQAAGLHCSANERRADEASRDVEAWLKCRYMREHLGEEFSGVVSAATTFGIFVTLDAMYVEGLVHITELGGEYFKFDEARQELRGERTGIRYAIGTRVRVQVSRVDLDGRRIDFRLVRDGEDAIVRAMKDKGVVPHEGRDGAPGRRAAGGKPPRRVAATEPGETARSPIQALQAAVKKAARGARSDAKPKGRKPRRG